MLISHYQLNFHHTVNNSISYPLHTKLMSETRIGGRPAEITKEGDKIKIVFHPIQKDVKHPKAKVFSIVLSKADIDALKKAF